MPEIDVPFDSYYANAVDEFLVEKGCVRADNVVRDDFGNWRKRAGSGVFATLPATIDPTYPPGQILGAHWDRDADQLLFADSRGVIHEVNRAGTVTRSSTAAATLTRGGLGSVSNKRIQFAKDTRGNGVVCGGGTFYFFRTGAFDFIRPQSNNVPGSAKISDVLFYDDFFLMLDTDTNLVNVASYSVGLEGSAAVFPYQFLAADVFRASVDAANILRIMETGRQIALFSSRSIEFWSYTSSTPAFQRAGQSILNRGLGAENSLVNDQGILYFIDNFRNVIQMDGMQAKIISAPINYALDKISDVSDCWGGYCKAGPDTFVVFHFPSAGKTFAFDIQRESWFPWYRYVAGEEKSMSFRNSVLIPEWNTTLACGVDGNVYVIDPAYYDDNGEAIRSVIRSPFYDGGSANWKYVPYADIRLFRGVGVVDEENPANTDHPMKAVIRYRDDHRIEWREREVSLGRSGDHRQYRRINRLGRYRRRQWEIEHTEKGPFTFMGVKEIAEVGLV